MSSGNPSTSSSLNYAGKIQGRLSTEPELEYLAAFIKNSRRGNNVCKDRNTLARDVTVLQRTQNQWHRKSWSPTGQAWQSGNVADGYAIIANYVDPEMIQNLTETFGIDAKVFRIHIDGCEQHYQGDWSPSRMTSPSYLRTETQNCRCISVDYRRSYHVSDESGFLGFDRSRKERCSLLRSHHRAKSVDCLFEHERCTIAWSPAKDGRTWSGLVILCDPGIGNVDRDTMVRCAETSIRNLPPDQEIGKSTISAMGSLFANILILWNRVIFFSDIQISALEDQLEHDFWDKQRNPVTILHEAQRVSRNLMRYRDQLASLQMDLEHGSNGDIPEGLSMDLSFLKERLDTLVKRTNKAVPALLASIAINEGTKASSLTAVALWFAPLSLSVSIVGIDGDTRFGGRKYWIWACIAIPLLALVILLANTSDRFITWLGKRKRGRALMSFFKPDTHIGFNR